MAGTAQVDYASDWINRAMLLASVTCSQLSRKSGVPVATIQNIIHRRQKNGCRVDILFLLVKSCGFTFMDFDSIVRPLQRLP